MKLVASLDPSVESAGWFGGTICAVIGGPQKLRPPIGVERCGVNRLVPQGNDVYRVCNGEFVEVLPICNLTVYAEIGAVSRQDLDGTLVELPFNRPGLVQQGIAFNPHVHATFRASVDLAAEASVAAGDSAGFVVRHRGMTKAAHVELPGATCGSGMESRLKG